MPPMSPRAFAPFSNYSKSFLVRKMLYRGASAKFPILAAVFRVQKLDCICKKKPTQF